MTASGQSGHPDHGADRRLLAELDLPSEPGNERQAAGEVAEVVEGLGLQPERLERLKTAVAEATMNAMEHGNGYRREIPVTLKVFASCRELSVRITDRGGSPVPVPDQEAPDLEAKLEGLQTPRGWGLFLIRNMVDEMNITSDEEHHTVELVVRLEELERAGGPEGGEDAS